MKTYELINPSDKILFDAENNKIAFFCTMILSNGKFGCDEINGDYKSSLYILGIDEETLIFEIDMDIDSFIELYRDEINECFKSFRYVNERSSMNKIVDCAHNMILKEKPWDNLKLDGFLIVNYAHGVKTGSVQRKALGHVERFIITNNVKNFIIEKNIK